MKSEASNLSNSLEASPVKNKQRMKTKYLKDGQERLKRLQDSVQKKIKRTKGIQVLIRLVPFHCFSSCSIIQSIELNKVPFYNRDIIYLALD